VVRHRPQLRPVCEPVRALRRGTAISSVTPPNGDLIAGRRFYDQGNWELAERHLRAGLALDPTSGRDHAVLAGVYAKRRRPWEARLESDEALRLDPHSRIVLAFRVDVLLACGDVSGAVAACRELVAAVPSSSRAHSSLAFALIRARRPRAALRAADEALRIDAADADGLSARAMALTQLGRPEDGEAAMREALRLHPNAPSLQNNMGLIQLRRGQPLAARESFWGALRVEPNQRSADTNLSHLRLGIVPFLVRITSAFARGRRRLAAIPLVLQVISILILGAAGVFWPWVGATALIGGLFVISGIGAKVSAPWFDRFGMALEHLPPILQASVARRIVMVAYLLAVFGGLTLAPGAMLALALPVVLGSDHLADLLIGALAIVVGLGSVVAASSVLSGQAADDAAAFSIWMFVVGPLASVVFATIRDYWQHRG
jgi:Flp pilus assembly protein TadD